MSGREISYLIAPSNDSTVAVEVSKKSFFRRSKHFLAFENFNGELQYTPDDLTAWRLKIRVDARSVVCRDKRVKSDKKRRRITDYARGPALAVNEHAEIHFSSNKIIPKRLRGFVVEGTLTIRGETRAVNANVVLSPRKNGRFQIDADATVLLSDFGIEAPSAYSGLVAIDNEVSLRLLLWATPVGAAAAAEESAGSNSDRTVPGTDN